MAGGRGGRQCTCTRPEEMTRYERFSVAYSAISSIILYYVIAIPFLAIYRLSL